MKNKIIVSIVCAAFMALFVCNVPVLGAEVEMTAKVGPTNDLTKIPITLYLTNPDVEITAIEASLEAPVRVSMFVYDKEQHGYAYSSSERWRGHDPRMASGTALHGANAFFISIAEKNSTAFEDTEGPIITVYFDGSELSDGEYSVRMFDVVAVKVGGNSYHVPDADIPFTIVGRKIFGNRQKSCSLRRPPQR